MLSSLVFRASSSPGLAGVVREMLLEAADNIIIKAVNESSRSFKFHNHGENVKVPVAAFNKEKVLVSRGLLCDCEPSNFAKARFKL